VTAEGAVQAVFELRENIARLIVWPYVFCIQLTVTAHGQDLELKLAIQNTGDTVFQFSTALHTYFAVENIADVRLFGLAGHHYRDSANAGQHVIEEHEAVSIVGEVDRIYANVRNVILHQPHSELHIHQTGFVDAVVWNPGAQKAATLPDLEKLASRKCYVLKLAPYSIPLCWHQVRAGRVVNLYAINRCKSVKSNDLASIIQST